MRMRKAMTAMVLACGCLLLPVSKAQGQGKITGTAFGLKDDPINQLPYAVFLEGGGNPVKGKTKANGSFEIQIPEGTKSVLLEFGGPDGDGKNRTKAFISLKAGKNHEIYPVVPLVTAPPPEKLYPGFQPPKAAMPPLPPAESRPLLLYSQRLGYDFPPMGHCPPPRYCDPCGCGVFLFRR
jgi:hypothetical protein